MFVGKGKIIILIHFGGKFEGSSKYIGGDTKILQLNNNIDYDGLKKMVAELLNVDDSNSKMHLKFPIRNPAKPL